MEWQWRSWRCLQVPIKHIETRYPKQQWHQSTLTSQNLIHRNFQFSLLLHCAYRNQERCKFDLEIKLLPIKGQTASRLQLEGESKQHASKDRRVGRYHDFERKYQAHNMHQNILENLDRKLQKKMEENRSFENNDIDFCEKNHVPADAMNILGFNSYSLISLFTSWHSIY